MSDRSLYSENVNLRWIITGFGFVAAGVATLWFDFQSGTRPSVIAAGFGTALISVGLIGIGYELLLRRSVIRETLAAIDLDLTLARRGILKIGSFADIDWISFFEKNVGDIDICFAYGRTWSASHAQRILKLSAEADRRIRLTVLDPEPPAEAKEPEYLDVYTHEYSAGTRSKLVQRIGEALDVWHEEAKRLAAAHKRPRLVIEGIRSTVPYTFYRSGDAMWVVFAARRRQRVGGFLPAILCAKTDDPELGLYDWVVADLEACRSDSVTRDLYRSQEEGTI